MEFSKVQKSVLDFVNDLFEWSDEPEAKLVNYVDHDLWEESELWAEDPTALEDIFRQMRDRLDRSGEPLRTGRNLSYVNNGSNYASTLGELLANQLDMKNSGAGELFEKVVIQWICHELGLSPEADGYLTTGGTPSTVISVAAAREAMGVDISEADSLTIYMTSMTHVCLDKAVKVAGLGRSKIRMIQTDKLFGMEFQELEKQIISDMQAGLRPFMIVASYGTVGVGSTDPLREIAKIASKYKAWLHLDGAIGGFLPIYHEVKARTKGIFSLCDSIILDSHKILAQSFGSSVVLLKNGRHKYLGNEPGNPTWSNPLENEMMPRGFSLWFSLNAFGVKTFRNTMKKHLELANYAADYLRWCQHVVVLPPFTVIVAFRCEGATQEESNARTFKWFKLVHNDGRVVLSKTTENGFMYIRIACVNFRAHLSEIDFCLEVLTSKLGEVLGIDEKKLQVSKPPADTRWLHQFEKSTKVLEQDIRLQYPYFLEMVPDSSFIFKQGFSNGKTKHVEKDVRNLWPSETPRCTEALLQTVSEIPRKDVSKTRCSYAGVLGQFLTSILHVHSGKQIFNPGAVELELKIIGHLASKFAMPKISRGVLSSDRCTTNILALLAARDDKLTIHKGAPRPVVYLSKKGHQHFLKPLHILGLSNCIFHVVDSDSNGALDSDDLRKTINQDRMNPSITPWLVAENIIGGQDSGLPQNSKMADFFAECNLWHHIEISGLDPRELWSYRCKPTLKDFSTVDSLSVEIGADLCQSVGIAAVVVSGGKKLRRALTSTREMAYLPKNKDDDVFEAFGYSFELTRPCRASPLWFTLNFLGTNNLKED